MNDNYGQAIACYRDLADVPVGAVYVTDVRPTTVVYLVFAFADKCAYPGVSCGDPAYRWGYCWRHRHLHPDY